MEVNENRVASFHPKVRWSVEGMRVRAPAANAKMAPVYSPQVLALEYGVEHSVEGRERRPREFGRGTLRRPRRKLPACVKMQLRHQSDLRPIPFKICSD